MKGKLKYLILSFVSICGILIFAYLFFPQSYRSLDSRVRDFYFKIRGNEKASDDIVIIDIDEKSLKVLGQWPWEREKFAQILVNLTKNGAGIIGLDIVFAESDKTSPDKIAKKYNIKTKNLPNYDYILAKTISQTPTILGYIFDFNGLSKKQPPQIPAIFIQRHKPSYDFIPQAKGVVINIPILQNASYSSGYVNNIPDEMGIIRSVPMLISYDGVLYPSLAFEMFRIATNSRKVIVDYSEAGVEGILLGKTKVKTDRFAKLHVNFRGPFKSYRYISAVDVYENKITPKDVGGKFVLIGTSAYGLMDLRSTPMDSVIAGVEIHANVIDNLLHNDMIYKPSWAELADMVVILIASFVVIFLYSRLSLFILFIVYTITFFALGYWYYYLLFDKYIMLNILFPFASMFLSLISTLGINYMFEFRQKELVKNSFSKKVSKQVMEDLLSHPDELNLASKEMEVSIYFSDIRSFTTISENLGSPKRIIDFLNHYMNVMVKYIEDSQGTIDKFIGDAIMAYWNAPTKVENHTDKAVQSALKQIEMRDFVNQKIKKDFGFEVDYGIGINTGNVVVGEIGSSGRSDYTIIGDAVNLASRLEGLCKAYGVRLVVSEFSVAQLKETYVMQLLDIVRVKGKHEPVKIYEIIDVGVPSKEKQEELEAYKKAHELYMQARFKEAKKSFDKLFATYGKKLYNIYASRCEHLRDEDIKDFDGVFEFTTK